MIVVVEVCEVLPGWFKSTREYFMTKHEPSCMWCGSPIEYQCKRGGDDDANI